MCECAHPSVYLWRCPAFYNGRLTCFTSNCTQIRGTALSNKVSLLASSKNDVWEPIGAHLTSGCEKGYFFYYFFYFIFLYLWNFSYSKLVILRFVNRIMGTVHSKKTFNDWLICFQLIKNHISNSFRYFQKVFIIYLFFVSLWSEYIWECWPVSGTYCIRKGSLKI